MKLVLGVVLVILGCVGAHQLMKLYANDGGVAVGFFALLFVMLGLMLLPLCCESSKRNYRSSLRGDSGGLDSMGGCSDGGGDGGD